MTPAELHDDAMALAAMADRYRAAGFVDAAQHALTAAAHLDARAAATERTEPSRSILHRSAAWLALQAGYAADAQRLARLGLHGQPPERVARELIEVLEAAREALA